MLAARLGVAALDVRSEGVFEYLCLDQLDRSNGLRRVRHIRHAFQRVHAVGAAAHDLGHFLLVNRLLHDPSQVLRAMAASHDMEQVEAERLLRRLFRLDGAENAPTGAGFSTAGPVPGPSEGEVR